MSRITCQSNSEQWAKIRNCLETNRQFTEECIYKYRGKIRITIILHNRQGQDKWMSRMVRVKKFDTKDENSRLKQTCSRILSKNFSRKFVTNRHNNNNNNKNQRIKMKNINYKILETNRCWREDTFFAHPRSIRKQIASRRIHFHLAGEEEEEVTMMANKPLPPGIAHVLIKYFHSLWSCLAPSFFSRFALNHFQRFASK